MKHNISKVYEDNFDTLYRFFYYKTLNRHVAEDLTSRTFLAFVDKSKKKKDIEDPANYLFGVGRNIFNSYLRDKYNTKEFYLEDIGNFADTAKKEVKDQDSLSLEQRAMKHIVNLPKAQQKIARLRLIEKRTNKEIAEMLDKDTNYVKTTFRRALRSLERLVETGVHSKDQTGGGDA